MWVSGHCGLPGNEKTDERLRQSTSSPLAGPEAALRILSCTTSEAIQYWTEIQHCVVWNKVSGHKNDKYFISRPRKKSPEDLLNLLKLSRCQFRTVVAFLIRPCSCEEGHSSGVTYYFLGEALASQRINFCGTSFF